MRCGCPSCGTYMIHSESMLLGCICPECGRRCRDCLGTNTVISKEEFAKLKNDVFFAAEYAQDMQFEEPEPEEEDPWAWP